MKQDYPKQWCVLLCPLPETESSAKFLNPSKFKFSLHDCRYWYATARKKCRYFRYRYHYQPIPVLPDISNHWYETFSHSFHPGYQKVMHLLGTRKWCNLWKDLPLLTIAGCRFCDKLSYGWWCWPISHGQLWVWYPTGALISDNQGCFYGSEFMHCDACLTMWQPLVQFRHEKCIHVLGWEIHHKVEPRKLC